MPRKQILSRVAYRTSQWRSFLASRRMKRLRSQAAERILLWLNCSPARLLRDPDRDQDDILDSSGQKGRSRVDMNELLYGALAEQKRYAKTKHVIEYHRKPIKSVRRAIYRAFQRAGIKGEFFGAHALRHAGATWLADAGTDMRKIQRLTGHEDIKTLELIYADHSRGYLKEAVDFLDEAVSAGAKLKVRRAPQLRLVRNEGDLAR